MTEAEIKKSLTTRVLGRSLTFLETIDSTNAHARSLAAGEFVHGTLVITDCQTAGRGRLGRVWQSEPGKNLTFSVIVRPPVLPDRIGLLSLAAGLAIAGAVRDVTGLPALCKWPNDVLIGEKKCSGVLAEGVLERGQLKAVVVGIGLNVNQTAFSGDVNATSLALSGGKEFDRLRLLDGILGELERRLGQLERLEIPRLLDDWRGLNCMLGRDIAVDQLGVLYRGRASDVDDDGRLVVHVENRLMTFVAGDVHIRL